MYDRREDFLVGPARYEPGDLVKIWIRKPGAESGSRLGLVLSSNVKLMETVWFRMYNVFSDGEIHERSERALVPFCFDKKTVYKD